VPTASGFSRLGAVDPERVVAGLRTVLGALPDGVVPVVHCCAPDVPIELLVRAGAAALSFDVHLLARRQEEELGTAVEAGAHLLLGVVDPLGVRGARETVGPRRYGRSRARSLASPRPAR
jgi:hypothetical protein